MNIKPKKISALRFVIPAGNLNIVSGHRMERFAFRFRTGMTKGWINFGVCPLEYST